MDYPGIQSRPGNNGLALSISARTHPTDQMSMARVYSLNVSITSGARYQRVATYSVIKVELPSSPFAAGNDDRARPKSQSYF